MTEPSIAPAAPRAKHEPLRRSYHGIEHVDAQAWLKAPNWRQALHDPALLPSDIRAFLAAEAAYAGWHLAPLAPLRQRLVAEMRRYLDPAWVGPPSPYGPYLYEARYDGGEHPVILRQPREGGPATVLLDANRLAEGHAFFKLGPWRVAPSHRYLAYAVDTIGSESWTIRIRDLETGRDLPEPLPGCTGRMIWAEGGQSLIYVALDPSLRPSRLLRHRLLGPAEADALLYTEADPAWSITLATAASRRLGVMTLRNSDETEVHLIDLAAATPMPRLVAPRAPGLTYEIDGIGETLVIRTNADGAEDHKLVLAPLARPEREAWRDLVPHRPGIALTGHRCLAGYILRSEREDGLVRIVARAVATGEEEAIAVPEALYALRLEPDCEADASTLRYTVSTPLRPAETYAFDLTDKSRRLLARAEPPARPDPDAFVLSRIWATAADGERVPVSVMHRRDLVLDGRAPCWLHGYGAYGASEEADFRVERLPLLERGFVYAIAHVRGGGERGRRWYRQGRLAERNNAFTDFLAAAEALIAAGYTARGRIVAHGRSAGGMLVGAAANLDPGLFAGVVADVPFVDVLNTMLDEDLPLTPPEWLEWGDPIRDRDAFLRIRAYAPTEQVRAGLYPPVLAVAGLSDPRVTYWEPAKWMVRLRERAEGGPFLLVAEARAGHAGNEGRLRRLDGRAREIAFALRCVGHSP